MRMHPRRGPIRRRALGIGLTAALLPATLAGHAGATGSSGASRAAQLAVPIETVADWERHVVIPRPEVDALVLADRAFLWGLRISGLTTEVQVRAWIHGFGSPGRHPLPLRKLEEAPDTHTYKVVGGKAWRSAGNPRLALSINPLPGATADGLPLLGRLYIGALRLNSEGDTVLRARRGNFCIADLSRGGEQPPPVNCVTGEPFGPIEPVTP